MAAEKRLIERLKEDFTSRRREVECMGMKVFVTPLTPADQVRINALHPDDGALRTAEILVSKCVDAAGKPVFGKEDKPALKLAVAGDRLGPLLAAINGPGIETQAKN